MSHHTLPRFNQLAASIALVAGGLAFVPAAHAAAPKAGQSITNIATATYTDGNGNPKSVDSNAVTTTVLQVGSFTLVDNRTADIAPNGTASLSHTLTNTGNGTDTFTITLGDVTGNGFELDNVRVYLDANNDGVPDNSVDLNGKTVTLNAGDSVGLVVVSHVPLTATTGSDQYTLTVTSGFDPSKTDTDTDTVNVTQGAAVSLTKSASVSSVANNGIITYTLTYKNTGNADATNVVLQDVLDTANVTYVAGSARWSSTGTTALTDADDGTSNGINYSIDNNGKITIVLASVPTNTTGSVTFQVQAKSGQTADIKNTAFIDKDGDTSNNPNTPANPSSNTTVVARITGTINDSLTDTYADGQAVAGDVNKDDVVKAIGQVNVPVVFGDGQGSADAGPDRIVIHNTGSTTETFTVSYDATDLPAGSTVALYQADGTTPLSNNQVTVAAGGSVNIVVKVTLPANYSPAVDGNTTTDDVIIHITPASAPSGSAPIDTVKLQVVDVIGYSIDLFKDDGINSNGGAQTPNASGQDTGTPVETQTVTAGQGAVFQLDISNSGAAADTFSFGNTTLPAGWTVTYYADNGSGQPTGSPLTTTASIPVGSTGHYVAVVTPPATASNGSQNVVFTVTSTTNPALTDSLTDTVVVSVKRALSLDTDHTGQVAPGGTITYDHVLTNNGDVIEGVNSALTLAVSNNLPGWTTSVYVDLNQDGIADAGELVTTGNITDILQNYDPDGDGVKGLEAGQNVHLIVKVQAPAGATAGQQNTTVITVTPGALNGITLPALNNTDITTVNDGQVRLLKEQGEDLNCDGALDTGKSFTTGTISAKPGQCVVYRITASNDGNVPVTNVVISDNVPSFTTISTAGSNDGTVGTVASPAAGATGTVTNTVPTMAPASTARLTFAVKIDQ